MVWERMIQVLPRASIAFRWPAQFSRVRHGRLLHPLDVLDIVDMTVDVDGRFRHHQLDRADRAHYFPLAGGSNAARFCPVAESSRCIAR